MDLWMIHESSLFIIGEIMKRTFNPKIKKYTFLCSIVVIFCLLLWQILKKGGDDEISTRVISPKDHIITKSGNPLPPADHIKATHDALRKSKKATDLLNEWDLLAKNLSGADLRSERSRLINQATERLGTEEALAFAAGVLKRGEFNNYEIQVYSVMQSSISSCLTDESQAMARDWFAGLGDILLQRKLALLFGTAYQGTSFDEVVNCVSDIKTKQVLLTSRCSSMASISPSHALQALQEYRRLLPAEGNYSGLLGIAANVRGDYVQFLGAIPPEATGMEDKIQKAVVKSWGSQKPAEAAEYVVNNPAAISPECLFVVVEEWMGSSPADATEWIGKLDNETYKTIGLRSVVGNLKQSNPHKAWEYALLAPSESVRNELLSEAHAEWLKIDPDAANAALHSLSADGSK